MSSYFARNIQWGALMEDNTVTATFDIHDEVGSTVSSGLTVTDTPATVQTSIAAAVRERVAALNAQALARAEAEALYTLITQENELEVSVAA